MMPEFATEKEEAEFWDTHSPLDFGEPDDIDLLVARKDKSLTIRLDGRTYQQLKNVARNKRIGVSAVVRLILIAFLRR